MRNATTTTTPGFFSVTGRVLRYAFNPVNIWRNKIYILGAICAVQLLYSDDTTVRVSAGAILAVLLTHIAKKGYHVYDTVASLQRAMLEMEKLSSQPSQHIPTTTKTDLRDMQKALPGLAGAFATTEKHRDSTEALADLLMQEQKSDAELQALADTLVAEMQSSSLKH